MENFMDNIQDIKERRETFSKAEIESHGFEVFTHLEDIGVLGARIERDVVIFTEDEIGSDFWHVADIRKNVVNS